MQKLERFYRNVNNTKLRRGKVPLMEKFVEFLEELQEEEKATPNRKWVVQIAEKIKEKLTAVRELEITEKQHHEILKNRKRLICTWNTDSNKLLE